MSYSKGVFGFHLSPANIIGNLLFSGVGFVAFKYGKDQSSVRIMVLGGVLMGYSYVVSNTLWMYLIGSGLTAALFFGGD